MRKGIQDGVPIGLGYLSVSFTFGMMAVSNGIPVEAAVVISLTNVTSALCPDVPVTDTEGRPAYENT